MASLHAEQLGAPPLPAHAAALLDQCVQLAQPGAAAAPDRYPDLAPLQGSAAARLEARVRPAGRRGAAAASRVSVSATAALAAPPAAALRALLRQRLIAPRCRVFLGVRALRAHPAQARLLQGPA